MFCFCFCHVSEINWRAVSLLVPINSFVDNLYCAYIMMFTIICGKVQKRIEPNLNQFAFLVLNIQHILFEVSCRSLPITLLKGCHSFKSEVYNLVVLIRCSRNEHYEQFLFLETVV